MGLTYLTLYTNLDSWNILIYCLGSTDQCQQELVSLTLPTHECVTDSPHILQNMF